MMEMEWTIAKQKAGTVVRDHSPFQDVLTRRQASQEFIITKIQIQNLYIASRAEDSHKVITPLHQKGNDVVTLPTR